jgi:hypothetical protein
LQKALEWAKTQCQDPSPGNFPLIDRVLTDPTVLREKATRQEIIALLGDPGQRLKVMTQLRGKGYTVKDLRNAIQKYEEAEYYVRPQRVNVSDLVQRVEQQTNWVVKDLIPGSGFSLLVAPPKLGKSTTARYLAWCVATGEPFLGMEIPTPGPVLWVTGDETLQEVALGFQRIFSSCGDPGTIEVIQGYIRKDEYLNTLEGAILGMESRPQVVVIDTFAHAFDLEDVNNYGQVERVLSLFKARMERLSTPVLFLFHTNKHGAKGDLTSILGSTAIRGASSANIALHERTGRILLNAEIRLARGIKDLRLEIDWQRGSVHTSDSTPVDENAEAIDKASAVARVVRAHRERTGEWPTKTQVRDVLPIRGDRKTEYMNAALTLGWVEIESQGKKELLKLHEES